MVRDFTRPQTGITALLVCFLLSLFPLSAQEITANIVGTVTDASGSAVVNAKVTVTNTSRNGVIRTATTNDVGFYTAPLLPVGMYSVTAEVPGFKKGIQNNIELNVNEKLTVNLNWKSAMSRRK